MDCKEDVLDRASFVKQIIDLTMIVSENRKNCCFAIEGEWGSGKSFVLEKIQECLDKEKAEGRDRFFTVRYDCWEYDYYEEPVVAIISVLKDVLDSYLNLIPEGAKSFLLDTAKNMITKAGVGILKSKLGVDIGECIGESKSDAELYDQYFGFREAIETVRNGIKEIAKDQTVVIIVDELDRCLPTYAIKVLERIHHIFNGLENVVAIIAMEKKQIENSLHQIYGEGMDVDQYLKKFISFSVKLDNGSARNFIAKYPSFMDMFDIQENDEMESFLNTITLGLDIRTQEKIFEKAENMHRLAATSEKMNSEILAFEILTLCIKEKMKIVDIEWVSEGTDYPDIERMVGSKYFQSIRAYAENIRKHSPITGNGRCFCKSSNFIEMLIFVIAGLKNEYGYGYCGVYYCNDEKVEEEINFAKKIYNLLTI